MTKIYEIDKKNYENDKEKNIFEIEKMIKKICENDKKNYKNNQKNICS